MRPPRASLTVAIKATFDILPDGTCAIAPTQRPIAGDTRHDDDDQRSLRFDSDLALVKPRGECILAGTCHPPGGRPIGTSAVAFKIGPVARSIAVFGDRRWEKSMLGRKISTPTPFTAMDLCWERCFGGSSHSENPLGRGIDAVPRAEGAVLLPNLERPEALIASPSDRPMVAAAFPIDSGWKARVRRAGTYDARWLKQRWPFFPEDLDLEYFNAAPEEQRIRGYFRGDEEIALQNLAPGRPLVRGRLPGLRPRCFAFIRRGNADSFEEVSLELDTITVDADAMQAFAVWRGLVEVPSETLDEVRDLLVSHEALTARTPAGVHRARLSAIHAALAADDDGFVAEEPSDDRSVLDELPTQQFDELPWLTPPTASRDRVLAAVARGESLAGQDLSRIDLGGANLAGADLTGAVLGDARLVATNLTGACLVGAVLTDAAMNQCRLDGADATGADFTGAQLDGSSMTGGTFEKACFDGASMARVNLREAKLKGAEMVRATLADAVLAGAVLDGADLTRAVLERADCTHASMIETALEAARCDGVRMDDAVLTGLRASERASFKRASFKRAKAGDSRWEGAALDGANFALSELSGADMTAAAMTKAVLDGCVAKKVVFRAANLSYVTALGGDFMEACFESADLAHADFRGANLWGAAMWRARLLLTRTETALIERSGIA